MRVSEGFAEQGNIGKISKGTLANFWEQGTKFRKITVRKHSERVWEHGNIGQFWKGTREQGPPLGDPQQSPGKRTRNFRLPSTSQKRLCLSSPLGRTWYWLRLESYLL